MSKFEAYKNVVAGYRVFYPEWRDGQAHFNVLTWVDVEASDEVFGTWRDPFDEDARIPALLLFLEERWKSS